MAYDATKPLDDGYLADAPAELRELFRALKEDKIVNAGKLNGYTQGNANGNIPLNNGTLNTNLNADMLDGHDSAYFSASTHGHDAATTSAAGFMTATQVTKLNGIATGAEVNQNAFSNVTVGSSTIQADGKTDTLTLAAGTGITLTADTTNDKVTIKVTDDTYLPLSGGTMTGSLKAKMSAIRGTAPAAKIENYFPDYIDANNTRYGLLQAQYNTDMSSEMALFAYNTTLATGNNIGRLGIGCDANGKVYTVAPTPSVSDDSTKIATTAYVKNCVPKSIGSASVPVYTNSNGVVTACSNVSATELETASGTSAGARNVWYSYLGNDKKAVYHDGQFTYEPSTKTLSVGKLTTTDMSYATGKEKGWGVTAGDETVRLMIGSGGVNRGLYDSTLNKWMIHADAAKCYVGGYSIEKSVPADAKFTDTVYTHPTSAGYKHIPTGGSSGQYLKYSASGTAVWAAIQEYANISKNTTGYIQLQSGITLEWKNDIAEETTWTYPKALTTLYLALIFVSGYSGENNHPVCSELFPSSATKTALKTPAWSSSTVTYNALVIGVV